MRQQPDRSDRARLEKTLPPLRLPTTPEERRRFERRLDVRLATLARSADCTPEQCIGLALWLRSQGWKAFEIELPDNKKPTGPEFVRNLLIEVALYERPYLKGKQLGAAAIDLAAKLGLGAAKKGAGGAEQFDTWHQYARRKRDPAYRRLLDSVWVETAPKYGVELPPELVAAYDQPSIPAPRDIVKRAVVQQMKRELEASAARLQSC
jgi:hypothetical protein